MLTADKNVLPDPGKGAVDCHVPARKSAVSQVPRLESNSMKESGTIETKTPLIMTVELVKLTEAAGPGNLGLKTALSQITSPAGIAWLLNFVVKHALAIHGVEEGVADVTVEVEGLVVDTLVEVEKLVTDVMIEVEEIVTDTGVELEEIVIDTGVELEEIVTDTGVELEELVSDTRVEVSEVVVELSVVVAKEGSIVRKTPANKAAIVGEKRILSYGKEEYLSSIVRPLKGFARRRIERGN